MYLEYSIVYKAENTYENWVDNAHWQFLIIPEENDSQDYVVVDFKNSLDVENEFSINGFGFRTIRVRPREKFKSISFEASFKLVKREVNPFDFEPTGNVAEEYKKIQTLDFKIDFERFLSKTPLTTIPLTNEGLFQFDDSRAIFENLQNLNHWTFMQIYFKAGVTNVNTALDDVIKKRHGVCQDFAHLFCGLARHNGIPTRYVSGYLHQGNGYFGDSQMHAWVEALVPNIGWVGFDPTNDLLASSNHIKVAHGKDYNDCSPLKGIVSTSGKNETIHSVQVSSQQQVQASNQQQQ